MCVFLCYNVCALIMAWYVICYGATCLVRSKQNGLFFLYMLHQRSAVKRSMMDEEKRQFACD